MCHKCDNRLCVNPNHLFLGTQNDNIQDMYKKGRARHPSGIWHWSKENPGRAAYGNRNGAKLYPERMTRGDKHYSSHSPHLIPRGKRHYSYLRPDLVKQGEEHGMAKLNEEEVIEIRRLYAKGKTTHRKLAKQFGVWRSTIAAIIHRRLWKYV